MKKIIIFLLSYFLLGSFSVSANRYGAHSVWHNASGVTSCNQDGQGVAGICAQIGGLPAVGTAGACPHPGETGLWTTAKGNMTCLYWDQEAPTISTTYPTNVWRNGTQTITLTSSDTGGSGIASTKWCEGAGCTPSTTYVSGITKTGDYINTIRFQTWDTAGNASIIGSVIVKIDNTLPTVSTNIDSIIPGEGSELLADNAKNFQITTSSGGGSPITSVLVYFEDYNSINSYKATSNECISSCIQNIQEVDNSLTPDGGRDYSLRISQICDEAGNCAGTDNQSSNLATYNYHVFSDISNIDGGIITNELTNSLNIADGKEKNLTINLKDGFGNKIVPLPSIGRNISFTFDTDNDLYLDEHLQTGNGVYLNTTTDTDTSNYLNRISIGPDITTFSNQTSFDSNGNYNYGFKVYTPTKNVYDKAFGNLVFGGIFVSISDDIGNNINTPIDNSTFDARFLPIYQTAISGGIEEDGMIDGTVQSSNITISKNSTAITPSSKRLYVEFGSGDTNSINTKYDLYHGTGSANNLTGEGSNYTVYKDDTMFSPTTYSIFTKLTPTGGTLSDIQNSYFSTHIGYTLVGPNGGTINPIYNGDVFGKDNYWGPVGTGGTYASVLKVIGKTYTQSFTEILEDQAVNEVNLLNGMITKSSLKTEVRRNAYNIIRNTTETNSGNTINNSNFLNNVDGAKLLNGTMLYFGGLEGKNVTLNSLTFEGNKTILVEGGNLYITGDINVTGYKSLLSIVVLKDINGNGGNIYIKPNVKSIKSVIYADKSLMSAEDLNGDGTMQTSEEYDGNTGFATLRNQLYIYGSVFSENTIGGSRATPLKCPYYVSSCINQDLAQKYDLNYLRRYYLKDTNNDGIGDTPAGSLIPPPNYFGPTSPYYKYPVVIEYNPLIQTDTPLIFMN